MIETENSVTVLYGNSNTFSYLFPSCSSLTTSSNNVFITSKSSGPSRTLGSEQIVLIKSKLQIVELGFFFYHVLLGNIKLDWKPESFRGCSSTTAACQSCRSTTAACQSCFSTTAACHSCLSQQPTTAACHSCLPQLPATAACQSCCSTTATCHSCLSKLLQHHSCLPQLLQHQKEGEEPTLT